MQRSAQATQLLGSMGEMPSRPSSTKEKTTTQYHYQWPTAFLYLKKYPLRVSHSTDLWDIAKETIWQNLTYIIAGATIVIC